MDAKRIAELRKLCGVRAMERPWFTRRRELFGSVCCDNDTGQMTEEPLLRADYSPAGTPYAVFRKRGDAELAAAARNALPELLDDLSSKAEALAKATEEVECLSRTLNGFIESHGGI